MSKEMYSGERNEGEDDRRKTPQKESGEEALSKKANSPTPYVAEDPHNFCSACRGSGILDSSVCDGCQGTGERLRATRKNLDKSKDATQLTVERQLADANIDTSAWGKGQAKTLAYLLKEIESGETVLTNNSEGKLIRKVEVGNADVYYRSPEGKTYRLKEDRQIFKDGRERQRNLGSAVSEKMKLGEDPTEAMIRGIREELGLDGDLTIREVGTEEHQLSSPSYPGLLTQYITHKYEVILDDEHFRSEGYTEEQDHLTTYFTWEEDT